MARAVADADAPHDRTPTPARRAAPTRRWSAHHVQVHGARPAAANAPTALLAGYPRGDDP